MRPCSARRLAGWAGLAAAGLALAGCLHYDARIEVGADGAVQVRERLVLEPQWRRDHGDSLNAAERIVSNYVEEAKGRGGTARRFGADSAHAEFRYPSLAAFAHGWPDTSDNGTRWDRSLYRRFEERGTALEELILYRMSPPDPERSLPHQRQPVLSFTVRLPVEAARHNAHAASGTSYRWVFTERMSAPDSVWIVWPAAPGP